MNGGFWQGRRIFLTGHTGFKGSWLSLWLNELGASVYGYSLPPLTSPSLFQVARVQEILSRHVIGDIRDSSALQSALRASEAELVIHMAAQPLVRHSYHEPVETYSVNVMGTVQVLEAVRTCPGVRAVIVVTTDKCYDNREWVWGYREHEALGGRDPYSSSKACAELVTAAYRSSFLAKAGVGVASARAGNVIGGGDWATDRLLPDFFRAAETQTTLRVRYPDAIRPWQHVLQPLSGYLLLARNLLQTGARSAAAWNFGPEEIHARPVKWVLEYLAARVPEAKWEPVDTAEPPEAGSLRLDSSKARALLGWTPHWSLEHALDETLHWHARWRGGADMQAVCLEQIREYDCGT